MTILISQTISKLTHKKSRIHVFKYDLEKKYKMNKIKVFIKAKIMQIPNYMNRIYILNIKYEGLVANQGWQTSYKMRFNEIDNINEAYAFLKDSDIALDNLKARYLEIMVTDSQIFTDTDSDMGASNDKNDCLFSAIFRAFNFDKKKLPSNCRSPSNLKKRLELGRADRIPLSMLPKVEELYNISFSITGDKSYISSIIQKHHLCLKFIDNHVQLKQNVPTYKIFLRYKPVDVCNVNTIYYGDEIILYNGVDMKAISDAELKIIKYDNNMLLITCDELKEITKVRAEYITKADNLIEVSKGLINFYKTTYDSYIAYDIFRKKTMHIMDPEELDDSEHYILDDAFHGGLQYSNDGKYNNVYDYDMNSMYCSQMQKLYFIFPVKKPEYKIFTENEFIELKFYPFGLYLVNV